jgi:hypothetical protein
MEFYNHQMEMIKIFPQPRKIPLFFNNKEVGAKFATDHVASHEKIEERNLKAQLRAWCYACQ